MMRLVFAELRYAVTTVGYWLRPFDMLADARRWRWQRRTPCGQQVWAEMPADVQRELVAVTGAEVIACHHCGTPRRIDSWCGSAACERRVAKAQHELDEIMRRAR